MCGIFCTIIYNQNTFLNEIVKKGELKQTNPQFSEYWEAFKHRGPDHYEELLVDITPYTLLQFAGSVLWTQGPNPVAQPVCDEDGNVLLWNGDIFAGPLENSGNDTKTLSKKLLEISREGLSVPEVFASVRGPYSFIYYQKRTKTLYFGRDVIGRHSLLLGYSQRSITISSIATKSAEGFTEVPAAGVFSFCLEKDGETPLTLNPWSHISENILDVPYHLPKQSQDGFKIGEIVQTYLQPLRRNNKTPPTSDLEMWTVQDQDTSIGNLMEKLTFSDSKTRMKKTMASLMAKSTIQIVVEDLLNTLKEAVRVRIEKQPKLCKNCGKVMIKDPENVPNCKHSKVAVLFSGGLDSAVLASLTHRFLPQGESIDLLNVAFEKAQSLTDVKQGNRVSKKDTQPVMSFNVPDRLTGLSTFNELKTIHPDRKWNFVEINITREELKKEREEVIANLIYPLNTVLDDSLGCALWFASRGQGILNGLDETYISPARIIISGIGADEQLGGYMRHRTTLKHRGGWEALDKELQYELKRISLRNLGRDDRIVSDHGRQLRMPYLDEDVINYLSFLPPWNRCFPVDSMPPGLGDKLLLRLAAWELGFRDAANLPKRAMQFGSRIANSKEKGGDVSGRL